MNSYLYVLKLLNFTLGVQVEISSLLEDTQVPVHGGLFFRSCCFCKEKSWFPVFGLDAQILSWGEESDDPQYLLDREITADLLLLFEFVTSHLSSWPLLLEEFSYIRQTLHSCQYSLASGPSCSFRIPDALQEDSPVLGCLPKAIPNHLHLACPLS